MKDEKLPEFLKVDYTWDEVFKRMENWRKDWIKEPLPIGEDEKKRIVELVNRCASEGENIVLFGNKLKGKDAILWEFFLLSIRYED